MSQFYAKGDDEYRCRKAILRKNVVTISGMTADGNAGTFTGVIVAVEGGLTAIAGHPLRITMRDSGSGVS
jgi:hypothetical protein